MSVIEVRVMYAPENAAHLRQQLGPFVAWEDWLRDSRRGKGHRLAGIDLQRCASMKGLCRRPVYAVVDIARFGKTEGQVRQRDTSEQITSANVHNCPIAGRDTYFRLLLSKLRIKHADNRN